jgi:DNA-binding GntR family transcriptional regulator
MLDPAPPDLTAQTDDRAMAIRDQLRDAIIEHRLAPGTKLSEVEVGKLFDVSRTVVRAALQSLTFEGLIRAERNRGAFVASPSPDEARQLFEARRQIEAGIARLAAQQAGQGDFRRFDACLEEETRLLQERGPASRRAAIRASGEFHILLAEVAGNAIMRRFMEELIARSSLVIALYGRTGASSCGHNEHGDIVAALRARDAERASHLVLVHIDHIEADLDLTSYTARPLREALGK